MSNQNENNEKKLAFSDKLLKLLNNKSFREFINEQMNKGINIDFQEYKKDIEKEKLKNLKEKRAHKINESRINNYKKSEDHTQENSKKEEKLSKTSLDRKRKKKNETEENTEAKPHLYI